MMKLQRGEKLKKLEVLTKEEEFSLSQIMNRKYAVYLNGRFFRLDLKIDYEAAYATVTLLSKDESFYYPVDARIAHKDQEIDAKTSVLMLLDYVDIYFDEYFREQENTFLSLDWTAYSFEGTELEMKAQVRNKHAETLADQIISGKVDPKDLDL
jgi:hypothetical protein